MAASIAPAREEVSETRQCRHRVLPPKPLHRLTNGQTPSLGSIPVQMQSKDRVGQRPICGERVEQRRGALAAAYAGRVGECGQTREAETSDAGDMLGSKGEVRAGDYACQSGGGKSKEGRPDQRR